MKITWSEEKNNLLKRERGISFLDFNFIDNRENVVFIGSPGVGKTHLKILSDKLKLENS